MQYLQWIGNLTTNWKFLPWTHEIPPSGGIPPRLGTTALQSALRSLTTTWLSQRKIVGQTL